jgi:HEAT repeat protein
MRARLPFWGAILLLMIGVIALGIRRHSGQHKPLENKAPQSQVPSLEAEDLEKRVAPFALPPIVAHTNEPSLQEYDGPKLPLRSTVSEVNINELAAQLSDPEFQVRFAAGQALNRMGSNAAPAVPMIGYLLAHEPQKVHDIMLKVLEDCVPEAQAAIPALQNCLTNSDVDLRINCARTLWVLDNSQAETVRPIAEACLDDPNAGPRIEAASLLWRMHRDPAEVVPTLIALLGDSDTTFDFRTILLLKSMGPAAKDAVPALESWLTSGRRGEEFVTSRALEALQRMRGSK